MHLPTDNEGEMGEKKNTGKNFPVYSNRRFNKTVKWAWLELGPDWGRYLQHWPHPLYGPLRVDPVARPVSSWSETSYHSFLWLSCHARLRNKQQNCEVLALLCTLFVWCRRRLISSCCWRINCLSRDAASFCSRRRLISAWERNSSIKWISRSYQGKLGSYYAGNIVRTNVALPIDFFFTQLNQNKTRKYLLFLEPHFEPSLSLDNLWICVVCSLVSDSLFLLFQPG